MPQATVSVVQRASVPSRDQRQFWAEAFRAVRAETERRAAPLSAEDQVVQSMADASPTKWHRAHTTWFFEQFLLKPHAPDYREFDERFALPVQLLLRRGRSAPRAAGARHDHAAEHARRSRPIAPMSIARSRGCCEAPTRPARDDRSGDRDRPAPRAAASGTAADRHPARVRAEPDHPAYDPRWQPPAVRRRRR